MFAPKFSLFGSGGDGYNKVDAEAGAKREVLLPKLKVETDKDVYRPGDSVFITIEIYNPGDDDLSSVSLLIERLGFEIKGIEKLDAQWFATQKPLPGSKQRRGFWSIWDFLFCISCILFKF